MPLHNTKWKFKKKGNHITSFCLLQSNIRLKLKEEYELKYKEFEMEVSKYQLQQNSQNDQLARLDSMYKQKIQEAEELRGKLLD